MEKIDVSDVVTGQAYSGVVVRSQRAILQHPLPNMGRLDDLASTLISDMRVINCISRMQKAVAAYGCFVDIGATTDGLVHISQLSNEYVKDVNSFVTVGQQVTVKVLGVEGANKIALTMKDDSAPASMATTPLFPELCTASLCRALANP